MPNRASSTSFQKGKSGNPSGRPKGVLSGALKKELDKKYGDGSTTNLQELMKNIVKDALAGDTDMRHLIFNRIDGKETVPVDLDPEGKLPITFTLHLGSGAKPA